MSAITCRFLANPIYSVWTAPGDDLRSSFLAMERSLQLSMGRTARGDAEAQRPTLALRRPVRELLFLLGRPATIDRYIDEVHEARLADAMTLLSLGLSCTTSFDAGTSTPGTRVQFRSLIDALLALSSDDLYALLTHQAKRRLGLLQGFRMVLTLERVQGRDEQRALTVRFVQEVWRLHGEAGMRPLEALLKLKGADAKPPRSA